MIHLRNVVGELHFLVTSKIHTVQNHLGLVDPNWLVGRVLLFDQMLFALIFVRGLTGCPKKHLQNFHQLASDGQFQATRSMWWPGVDHRMPIDGDFECAFFWDPLYMRHYKIDEEFVKRKKNSFYKETEDIL